MRIAINTGEDDQFPTLGAFVFAGRNGRLMPADNVDGSL